MTAYLGFSLIVTHDFLKQKKVSIKWGNLAEQRENFPHVSVYINLEMPKDSSFSVNPNFCQQYFISVHTQINLRVGFAFPLRLPLLPPSYQKIRFFHQNGNKMSFIPFL